MLHQVGAGTLGPVFRAHDPIEGRLVAVKAFQLDLTASQAADFVRALNELPGRGLEHPSIAAPVAAGLEGGTPWLAQAYVPAESLDSVLRQYGPAPVADALAVVTQLAGALDFAAAAGVLHGALHPRDVLVAPNDTHLTDVGVAPALEALGIRAPLRHPYAAPERIDGAPISRATDVFALGALACELLTGRRIAGAGDAALAGFPEIPGAHHDALVETLSFALAVPPDERYTSALTFAAALKRALGEAVTRSTAPGPRRTPPAREPSAARSAPPVAASPSLPSAAAPDATPPAEAATPTIAAAASMSSGRDRTSSDSKEAARADETPAPPAVSEGASHAEPPLVFHTEPGPLFPEAVEELPGLDAQAEDSGLRWDDDAVAPEAPAAGTWPDAPRGAASGVLAHGSSWSDPRRTVAAAILIALLAGALVGFLAGWRWSSRNDAAPAGGAATAAVTPPAPTTPTEITPPPEIRTSDTRVTPEASGPSVAGPSRTEPSRRSETPRPAAPAASRQAAAPARPATGQLTIRSSPSGARVEIDGRARGTTPLTVRDLPLGSRSVRLTRSGYETAQRRVTLTTSRRAQTIDAALERVAPPAQAADPAQFTGSVLFETHPSGVSVYLDNKLIGVTPLQLADVRAGSHVVRFEKAGFRRWTASVRVVASQRTRVAASLEEDQGR